MDRIGCLVLLAGLAAASAAAVSPIEKVITLVEGLKKEVEDEGAAEASTYGKFACFCKDTTLKKSNSVKKGNDNIIDQSADIETKTAERSDDITELGERKVDNEKKNTELDETTSRCTKEKAEYDAEAADLNKAISSLNKAIKSMSDSRPASLLAIRSVVESVSTSTAMTKASKSTQQRVAAFMQEPGLDKYGFHSNDIIDLCESLLKDFKGSKTDLDTEYDKADKACVSTKKSLRAEIKANKDAMNLLSKAIARLKGEIAKHREDLVIAKADLEDDELYLKDLTARCEDRANDFDQRTSMRSSELTALKAALKIISGGVKTADDAANERAFLQSPKVSFLQEALVKQHSKQSLRGLATNSLELEAKKGRALDVLRSEGRRIGSITIAALTVRVAADPFKKVQGLIQKLIERLLAESAAEATKKGFCDEALAAARQDRDNRFVEANDLSREISALESKEDELTEEIKTLGKDIKDQTDQLKEETTDRTVEKKENAATLKAAKEGLVAVTDALRVLKSFYSSAAKASFIQASPVDVDSPGAASGSYKGKQGGMKAVFGLLEVIQSDFDRTVRTTEKSEAQAHSDYTKSMQALKSSTAGKETKKELDEQDLETTKTTLEEKYADLQSNMDLTDTALQELEKLKPTCIDTGMSYKERVQKREDEMAALKKALCILDTDKVESECA